MCINYSNEKLQLHFNEVIFKAELALYEAEKVPTDRVDFVDNTACVLLVESKPIGIIALLEEECSLGSGNDMAFLSKIFKQFRYGSGGIVCITDPNSPSYDAIPPPTSTQRHNQRHFDMTRTNPNHTRSGKNNSNPSSKYFAKDIQKDNVFIIKHFAG